MAGRGGCFKRQSPLANQAALVEAASARLGARAARRALRCPDSRTIQVRSAAPAAAPAQLSGPRCPRRADPAPAACSLATNGESIQVLQLFRASRPCPWIPGSAGIAEPRSPGDPGDSGQGPEASPPPASCATAAEARPRAIGYRVWQGAGTWLRGLRGGRRPVRARGRGARKLRCRSADCAAGL